VADRHWDIEGGACRHLVLGKATGDTPTGPVERRDRLGGLLHEYLRAA